MSQKFSLYDDLTVEENLDFYSGIYNDDSGRAAANSKPGLDGRIEGADRTEGQQQELAIRALSESSM